MRDVLCFDECDVCRDELVADVFAADCVVFHDCVL